MLLGPCLVLVDLSTVPRVVARKRPAVAKKAAVKRPAALKDSDKAPLEVVFSQSHEGPASTVEEVQTAVRVIKLQSSSTPIPPNATLNSEAQQPNVPPHP